MSSPNKLPLSVLLALTLGPALAIGITLWFVASLVPECTITERTRLTAPDNQFDLIIFARDCGGTPPNTQAALIPPGERISFDAASFFSAATDADLSPRWDSNGQIELTIPAGTEVLRQDETVAGVNVIYR